ncbi:hypothetical protein [Vibrio sp. WXL103]|uniref:hypothetical protein n=1 Tax=Vibrio sp. WXL103 TaxID=3450710 RepID=UPI003EC70E7F
MKKVLLATLIASACSTVLAADFGKQSSNAVISYDVPSVCGIEVTRNNFDINGGDIRSAKKVHNFSFYVKNNVGHRSDITFEADTDLGYVSEPNSSQTIGDDIKVTASYQKHNENKTLNSIEETTMRIYPQDGIVDEIRMVVDFSDIRADQVIAGNDQETSIIANVACL